MAGGFVFCFFLDGPIKTRRRSAYLRQAKKVLGRGEVLRGRKLSLPCCYLKPRHPPTQQGTPVQYCSAPLKLFFEIYDCKIVSCSRSGLLN